jgi:hypothetical protein
MNSKIADSGIAKVQIEELNEIYSPIPKSLNS